MLPKLESPIFSQAQMLQQLTKHQNNFKKPPKITRQYYVARKFNGEQLNDNIIDNDDSLNFQQISPIVEESLELSRRSKHDSSSGHIVTEQGSGLNNIFEEKQIISGVLNKYGPQYDSTGQIIQRSIIGKPEWFQKNNSLNRFMQSQSTLKMKMSIKQFTDNQSTKSKMKINTLNKIQKLEETVTKQQCDYELQGIKKRIQNNLFYEKQKLLSMHLEKRLQLTSQERILQKFQKQEENWKQVVTQISSQANRNYEDNVILRQDDYRNKREALDLFDNVKTDDERFGSNIWMASLRIDKKNKSLDKPKVQIVNDLPTAFRYMTIQTPKKDIELIKKPQITNLLAQIQSDQSKNTIAKMRRNHHNLSQISLQSTYSVHQSSLEPSYANISHFSVTQNKIYQNKLKKIESEIHDSQPIISEQVDFDELAVIGQNQLAKEETEILLKDKNYQGIYLKKLEQPQQNLEEIIELNYGKNNKVSQNATFQSKIQENIKLNQSSQMTVQEQKSNILEKNILEKNI